MSRRGEATIGRCQCWMAYVAFTLVIENGGSGEQPTPDKDREIGGRRGVWLEPLGAVGTTRCSERKCCPRQTPRPRISDDGKGLSVPGGFCVWL